MPSTIPIHSMLNEVDAADFLAVSPATLKWWRTQNGGPVYRKHGSRVAYAIEDLRAWSDCQRHPAPVRPALSARAHLV